MRATECRLAFFKGKSLTSRLIGWFNWGPYSHVAWYRGEGELVEAWQGVGVAESNIAGGLHTSGTQVDLFRIVALTDEEAEVMDDFCVRQIGKKYDLFGCLHFISRRPPYIADQDRWFCSELVATAAAAAGRPLLERVPPWKVSPSMLSYSPLLTFDRTIVVPTHRFPSIEEIRHAP
jgi:uncharacterized protein YycO